MMLNLSLVGDCLVWTFGDGVGDGDGPSLLAIRSDSEYSLELVKVCLQSLRNAHVDVRLSSLLEQVGEIYVESSRK